MQAQMEIASLCLDIRLWLSQIDIHRCGILVCAYVHQIAFALLYFLSVAILRNIH